MLSLGKLDKEYIGSLVSFLTTAYELRFPHNKNLIKNKKQSSFINVVAALLIKDPN